MPLYVDDTSFYYWILFKIPNISHLMAQFWHAAYSIRWTEGGFMSSDKPKVKLAFVLSLWPRPCCLILGLPETPPLMLSLFVASPILPFHLCHPYQTLCQCALVVLHIVSHGADCRTLQPIKFRNKCKKSNGTKNVHISAWASYICYLSCLHGRGAGRPRMCTCFL